MSRLNPFEFAKLRQLISLRVPSDKEIVMAGLRMLSAVVLSVCVSAAFCSSIVYAGPTVLACLDNSPPRTDVEVREVRLEVSADKKAVGETACIVSRRSQLKEVGVMFSAFDNNGHFLNTDGQSIGDIPNTTARPENMNGPPIMFSAGSSFQISLIDPKKDQVNEYTLVTVKWRPCDTLAGSDVSDCKVGPPRTDTFIIKARVVESKHRIHLAE